MENCLEKLIELYIGKGNKLSSNDQIMVKNMLEYIIEDNKRINFIKNFNDKTGFMFSDNPIVNEIGNYSKVLNDGHSGCSFALTLRVCQKILKYEESIDIINSYTSNNIIVEGSGSKIIGTYKDMDNNNKHILDTLASRGMDESIKEMFKDPNDPSKQLSYGEMRALYG